jgi:hypothetical protein
VPRRQRPRSPKHPARERAQEAERAAEPERKRALTRELVEFETGAEGTADVGLRESGTLPGSIAGTTGTAGHAAGEQVPGATAPPVAGIDPAKARRLVGKRRRSEEESSEE